MLSSDWIGFGFPRASTSRSLNCHLTLNDVRAGTLDPFCLTSRPSWLVSKKLADSVLIKGEISKTRRTFRRSIWKRTFLAREKRPTSKRKSPSLFWKIEKKGWLHSCRDFLSITAFHPYTCHRWSSKTWPWRFGFVPKWSSFSSVIFLLAGNWNLFGGKLNV